MRPLSIRVQRFRGWDDGEELNLDRPLTMLVGDNGDGKSSTLDAVGWCLYGGQVEVKGSGIDERQSWHVRHRHAADGPTEVELRLGDARFGRVRIRRRRAEGASAKADEVRVEVEVPRAAEVPVSREGQDDSGPMEVLEGDRAREWLETNLPDWPTFRRAHVQHQAAVRARLVNSADRTAVIGLLLGLGDDSWLQSGLDSRSASGTKLISRVDKELSDLEASLSQEFARHGKEVLELERRLVDGGLSPDRIGPAHIDEIRRRMLSDARSLAESLSIDVEIPVAGGEAALPMAELLAWTESWPSLVRQACTEIDGQIQARRESKRSLQDALAAAEGGASAVQEADLALRSYLEQHGEVEAQAARVAELEVDAGRSQRQLEQADVLVDLLEKARVVVVGGTEDGRRPGEVAQGEGDVMAPVTGRLAAGEPDAGGVPCPVCDQRHPDLLGHVEAALAHHGSAAREALLAERDEARGALEEAAAQLEQARALSEQLQEARTGAVRQRTALAELLHGAEESPTESRDPLAAARGRIERLGEAISGYEGALDARDQALGEHGVSGERLRLLGAWQEARRRAVERVDVTELSEWRVLQDAVDEAAGLAADQEALGQLARDAQVRRAKERAAEVNGCLGTYLEAILGDASARQIQVHVHQTPKNIEYQLWDGSGAQFVEISNQARLNAVSLALLFAQAQEQARQGRLAWAIIDDPVQSLDEHHQRGLARAIELLSEHCHVLLSATWSDPLVERIRTHVACERQIVTLKKHPERRCVIIKERESL